MYENVNRGSVEHPGPNREPSLLEDNVALQDTSNSQTGKRSWYMLLLLLFPATLIMGVDRAVLSVTAPAIQQAYGLTLPEVGWLLSAFFWAYAFMQIPGGIFVEKVGARWAMFVAILLWATMTSATTFATGFTMLIVFRALLGMGQSADWPAAVVSVNRLFASKQRPIANSILLCALYAGPVVGAPLTGYLLANVGLHGTFVTCGVAAAIFAFVWLAGFRENGAKSAVQPQKAPRSRPVGELLLPTLKSPRTWILALAYASLGVLVAYYVSWFPVYLSKARSQSTELMATFTGVAAGALCLGVVTAGYALSLLSRKTTRTLVARSSVAVTALLVTAAATCIVPITKSDIAALGFACIALISIGYAQVATWSAVQDIGGEDTGVLTGVVSLFGNFAAGFAPIVSAKIVDATGDWSACFYVVAGVSVIGSLLWVVIGQSGRRAGRTADQVA